MKTQAPDEQIEGLHCGVNGNIFVIFAIVIEKNIYSAKILSFACEKSDSMSRSQYL